MPFLYGSSIKGIGHIHPACFTQCLHNINTIFSEVILTQILEMQSAKNEKITKHTVMVVLETHLVIAKIKNLPRFLSSSSRVSIFCAARVVADFSDRATRADNKIYGVSNFRCTGTFTRTRFRIKRYTVLKSENSSFQ